MAIIRRFTNLVRGLLTSWVRRREHENPDAVYEAAIQGRLEQYAKLRAAAAGVLYMRTKLVRELEAKTTELARVKAQLDLAVAANDDAVALTLIERRRTLGEDVERLGRECAELESEAETAKKNLGSFHNEIARLRDERARMLARLANAKARLRLHETLQGLSLDADVQALDAVRDHVHRLLAEVDLAKQSGDGDLDRRLAAIRDAEAQAAARAELDELKRARTNGAAAA